MSNFALFFNFFSDNKALEGDILLLPTSQVERRIFPPAREGGASHNCNTTSFDIPTITMPETSSLIRTFTSQSVLPFISADGAPLCEHTCNKYSLCRERADAECFPLRRSVWWTRLGSSQEFLHNKTWITVRLPLLNRVFTLQFTRDESDVLFPTSCLLKTDWKRSV